MTARFWAKVMVTAPDECWLWAGGREGSGRYGRTKFGGRSEQAHRVAYLLWYGAIPEETPIIDHTCETKLCCNPYHLEAVTMGENTARTKARKRTNA